MCTVLHVMYMWFWSDFNGTCISLQIFIKKLISNFIKIRPTGAEFFHVDGHGEAVNAFCNLGNVSKSHLNQINLTMANNAYVIPLLTYSCGFTS